MSALSSVRETFSPLRRGNFRTYMIGQVISLIGTFLQMTAQGWVVWQLTGSTVALGTVSMLSTLPILFLGPWAGAWADRWDRRKLLIGTQVVAMILAFALAYLVQTDLIQLWHLYGMALILGVVTALDMPAQQAFIGDLAGMGELRHAVNLNAMVVQVSRILGPAFAGIIVGFLGAATAFWLNGLSFFAVVISLILVTAEQAKNTKPRENALSAFADGLRFLRTQPRLVDLVLFVVLITFFSMSIFMNILPAFADTVLGGDATTLGFLMAASGTGALISTVVITPIAQAQKRVGLVIGAAVIWIGLWLIPLGITSSLPIALLSIFMAGMAAPTVFTTATTMLQVMSPGDMRARMMSTYIMLTFGLQPLAAIMIGYTADALGVSNAILINGVSLVLGAALVMLVRAPIRRWEPGVATAHSR